MAAPGPSTSFRLSPQQALILSRAPAPDTVQCIVELRTPVDEAALTRSLQAIVERHECLRTTFPTPAGARGPVAQTVHDRLEPGFRRVGLGEVAEPPGGLAGLLAREAGRLDLTAGPSLRALLLDAPDAPLLVLSALAACADARSLALLAEELRGTGAPGAAASEAGAPPGAAASETGVPEAAAEPIQHADYAEWRHELRTGEEPETREGAAFWAAAGEPAERTRILFGDPGAVGSGPAEQIALELEPSLVAGLRDAAERARVSLATLLQAAWIALLARLSGAPELSTVWLGDGRGQPDLADAIGPYAQPLPLRVGVEPETSLAELLDRIARAARVAERWQDYATEAELGRVCRQAVAGFVFERSDGLRALTAGSTGCGLELAWAGPRSAELRYDATAYARRDAEEISAALRALLGSVAADPSARVGALAITTAERRAELQALACGPEAPSDPEPVHLGFERQAGATPEALAVAGGGTHLTYAELEAAANRLAHHLIALGADGTAPVAICLPRTASALVAVLAVMKTGSAYLPLNREHPAARMAHQLAEAGVRTVITELELLERLPAASASVVCLDRDAGRIGQCPAERPDTAVGGQDLAYVMYTSGSTGLPKGVAVTHGNLATYTAAIADRLGAEPGWQFAVVSELSTDLGNTAIYPALVTGGAVHLIDPQTAMDGLALSAYAQRHGLDVMKITPSHLRALLASGWRLLPRRWLICGGEALSWELVGEVRATGASCRVLNHYGPTEATVGATAFEVPAEPTEAATVPIGRALAGDRAYVMDGGLEPVPPGVPGELCLGGAGVARGYIGRPEETELRFVADPLGGRMYRTGDRVRLHPDGTIAFLGRVDAQLKIRGYRVEPGEVEAAIMRHPAVREVAVIAHGAEGEETRLVAYVVAPDTPSAADLHTFLAETLPEYMIPARWVPLDAIPLTPSGKIDRQGLPDPDTVSPARTEEFVAPRDELETEIAEIWSQLLGLPEVGVTDDFFALGGHSLLATQAIMRIRRAYGDIPLGALFNAPTVAALAETIRARRSDTRAGDR